MTTPPPQPALLSTRPWWLRPVVVLPLTLLATGAALLIDTPAYHALLWKSAETKDWDKALRIVGFLPVWLVIGLVMMLVDHAARTGRGWWRRGAFIAASAALSGGLAEIIKILVRRARPEEADGLYL